MFEVEIHWCSLFPFRANMQFIFQELNSVTLEHFVQEQQS